MVSWHSRNSRIVVVFVVALFVVVEAAAAAVVVVVVVVVVKGAGVVGVRVAVGVCPPLCAMFSQMIMISIHCCRYELEYIEENMGIKRGHRILQLAFGAGFKVNSAYWICNATPKTTTTRNVLDHQQHVEHSQ